MVVQDKELAKLQAVYCQGYQEGYDTAMAMALPVLNCPICHGKGTTTDGIERKACAHCGGRTWEKEGE